MSQTLPIRPRLRPVEAIPIENDGETMIVLHDPIGLTTGDIALSPPAYFLASMMDGTREPSDILDEFFRQAGQMLKSEQLQDLLDGLQHARYLEGPEFEAHYEDVAAAYRSGSQRVTRDLNGVGLEEDQTLEDLFGRMFPGEIEVDPDAGRIRGLIAPHIDYARGWECYARAYSRLRGRTDIRRFVILGTNHFGRSCAVVGTDKDFTTPLGTTRCDRAFLARLNERCGVDLCEYEFDHAPEHSVELQVFVLQSLFGAESFEIVPFLCPDPCGPTGTQPITGEGADLRVFSEHLRDLLAEDDVPTVIIAGADLSHVGQRFGDECELDVMFLHDVSTRDQKALIAVRENDPDKFRATVAEEDNPTRICSAGCIYTLLKALPDAEPTLIRYDQTVLEEQGTSVSCAAFVLTEPDTSA